MFRREQVAIINRWPSTGQVELYTHFYIYKKINGFSCMAKGKLP